VRNSITPATRSSFCIFDPVALTFDQCLKSTERSVGTVSLGEVVGGACRARAYNGDLGVVGGVQAKLPEVGSF